MSSGCSGEAGKATARLIALTCGDRKRKQAALSSAGNSQCSHDGDDDCSKQLQAQRQPLGCCNACTRTTKISLDAPAEVLLEALAMLAVCLMHREADRCMQ